MVFPFQFGSAFATSGCDSKRTAKKTMSALTASASFLGMIVGPIAAAAGAKLCGSRVVATDTSMSLRAKALARAWPILPKPIIAYFIMFLRSSDRTKILEAWSHDWRGFSQHGTASESDLRHAPIDGEI